MRRLLRGSKSKKKFLIYSVKAKPKTILLGFMKRRLFFKKFLADILGNFRNNVAVKKFSRPREDGSAGGGWGEECRAVRANTERGQARRPARSEQNPAKKFSFHFRRKNPARAKQEKRRKLFCWVASGSERRRAGFLSSVQSRFARSV